VVPKPGLDELARVWVRRNKVSDLLLGEVSAISAASHVSICADGGMEKRMCLECFGLLTSYRASIKAFSRSGLSAMRRSIMASTDGWPMLSQCSGTAVHPCFIRMSPQRGASDVVRPLRGPAERMESTENQ